MAERWQQWMPFHIDRWRGSASVQAMHPAAQMGYLYLLCTAWQSDDCCVSGDVIDLATASGLGDELWAVYGPRILRKFVQIAGRWRNEVLFKEWDEARKVYEKRKSGAVRTNSSRSADGERTQSSRNTDTVTGTVTTTKKQKPSRNKSEGNPVHTVFKGLIFSAWNDWGNEHDPPWDGAEGKQLGMLMGANPKLGPDGMRRLLQCRARSQGVNLAERPSKWLRTLTDYARGPLNQFKQPEATQNGTNQSLGNRKADAAQSALAAAHALFRAEPGEAGGDQYEPRQDVFEQR